ncbi:hypothetical protein J6590_079511 [Homalodisca vitripennis]|nr:hypothetical protein J6590_079511 [Homalodisca vitripennis]
MSSIYTTSKQWFPTFCVWRPTSKCFFIFTTHPSPVEKARSQRYVVEKTIRNLIENFDILRVGYSEKKAKLGTLEVRRARRKLRIEKEQKDKEREGVMLLNIRGVGRGRGCVSGSLTGFETVAAYADVHTMDGRTRRHGSVTWPYE